MMETSPFFTPGTRTKNNTLALLSLGRDQLPVLLRAPAPPPQPGAAPATAGAAGGPAGPAPDAITNTRFGSYPHSTLVEVPWGAQVSASNVGAAERRRGKRRKLGGGGDGGGGEQKKKKKKKGAAPEGGVNGVADDGGEDEDRDDGDGDAADEAQPATNGGFVAASSGFAHLAVPTPESWTGVLQHRTQVVYIPDCAYILHLLRARPGCRLIECGAGSGSFTHAAARAVFSGYPPEPETPAGGAPSGRRSEFGKVFSFEYHEQRFKFLRREIAEHGLSRVVRVTHRDVYERGFALDDEPVSADAVFLDLPAPWRALPHLTRAATAHGPSPLNPAGPVTLCSFSPCIEQAQRTVACLRALGWARPGMSELRQRFVAVRRERVGLQEEGLRGVCAAPVDVDEAVANLRELERKNEDFAGLRRAGGEGEGGEEGAAGAGAQRQSRQERLRCIQEAAKSRKLYKEGRLVHRTEPDMKTHTSYLVFAVLPREWSGEDEAAAEASLATSIEGTMSDESMKSEEVVKSEEGMSGDV